MASDSSAVRTYLHPGAVPFYLIHLGAIVGVFVVGFSWVGLLAAIGLYYGRMFFVTAGYHRYFAHRSFKTSRPFQFLLALGGTTAAQKGPLWWAAHHRVHHKYSDQPEDLHSPVQRGFWWSHVGWILDPQYAATDTDRIRDFARYPELRFLNRYPHLPAAALAVTLFAVGGWHLFVWGFLVSTVLLWHGTFTINSLAHVFGSRRYDTTDTSRNNALLALITMGEGWHNNHHHYQRSASQGFRWYEFDMSYVILRGLQAVGVVSGVGKPPAHVITGERAPQKRARRPSAGALAAPAARAGDLHAAGEIASRARAPEIGGERPASVGVAREAA